MAPNPSRRPRSTIHDIPTELLTEIFYHCVQNQRIELTLRPENPPWSLAKVNRRWRSICLSTGTLWTFIPKITIDDKRGPHDYFFQTNVGLLRTSLALSKPMPLSLTLHQRKDTSTSIPLFQTVLPHLHRCKSLSVPLTTAVLLHLSSHEWGTGLPYLEELKCAVDSERPFQPYTLDLAVLAPRLKRVSIKRTSNVHAYAPVGECSFAHLNIAWSGLTHITLESCPYDRIGQILKDTPRLRHCRLKDFPFSYSRPKFQPRSIFLPDLKMLALDCIEIGLPDPLNPGFLRSLLVPTLREFCSSYLIHYDDAISLISPSRNTLVKFHATLPPRSQEDMTQLLVSLSHVEDLEIRMTPGFMWDVIKLMDPLFSKVDAPRSSWLLPRLRNITLVSGEATGSYWRYPDKLNEFIESRSDNSQHSRGAGAILPLERMAFNVRDEVSATRLYYLLNGWEGLPSEDIVFQGVLGWVARMERFTRCQQDRMTFGELDNDLRDLLLQMTQSRNTVPGRCLSLSRIMVAVDEVIQWLPSRWPQENISESLEMLKSVKRTWQLGIKEFEKARKWTQDRYEVSFISEIAKLDNSTVL